MITFGDNRFVALDLDNEGAIFSPVKGRGGAHVLTLPSAERPGGDVLAFADVKGKMVAVCGSKLTASNLTQGAARGMCTHCDAFLRTEEYALEMARALSAWDVASKGTGESVLDLVTEAAAPESVSAPVTCPGTGRVPMPNTRRVTENGVVGRCSACCTEVPVFAVTSGKVKSHPRTAWSVIATPEAPDTEESGSAADSTPVAETPDSAAPDTEESAPVVPESTAPDAQERENAKRARRAQSEREAKTIAGLTDGKCAYEVPGDDGKTTLKIVHGLSRIAPVSGSESVNTSGEDTGTCPVCRTHVKLTGKGFVPTHRPGNVTPDGPVLTQKSVPAVEEGTAVADAAKVRESEATALIDANGDVISRKEALRRLRAKEDGIREIVVVPTAPEAGAAVGQRGHGRSDGVAMSAGNLSPDPAKIPAKGWAAKAGTMALPVGRPRPDAGVIKDVMHGGTHGYLTEDDYNLLSRTQQRTYWRNVKTARDRASAARALVARKREALGERLSAADRKAARTAASVGSSAEGTIARPVTGVNGK